MTCEDLKAEFRLAHLKLKHHQPADFITAQWPIAHVIYLLWRVGAVVFATVTMSKIIGGNKDFIFLTIWGFTILTVQVWLHLILTVIYSLPHSKRLVHSGVFSVAASEQDVHMPVVLRMFWLFTHIAFNVGLFISIAFWSLLYGSLGGGMSFGYYGPHALNAAYILMELMLGKAHFRLLHYIYALLFGVCYLIFTVIYYATGGRGVDGSTAIYPILDWSSAPSTLGWLSLGAFILLPVCTCLMYALYKLRLFLHSRCFAGHASYQSIPGNVEVEPVH